MARFQPRPPAALRGRFTIKTDPDRRRPGDPNNLILRSGTVVSAAQGTCRVLLRREHCAVCPANDGADSVDGADRPGATDGADGGARRLRCGVGFAFPREIELRASGAAHGDCVLLGVSRSGMSLAAAVVFGLPLSLMLASATVTHALWDAAFAGAAGGLVVGAALALRIARRTALEDWVNPVLVEIRAGGGVRCGTRAALARKSHQGPR